MNTKTKKSARIAKTNGVDKSKKVTGQETTAKVKITKKQKAALDTKNVKDTVKMAVESQREIKYKYPAEIKDQLERKGWRQKVRAKLSKLESNAFNATGKEKKEADMALQNYRKEVLLVP